MQTDGRSVLGNDPTLDRSSRTSTGARTEEWEAGGTENSGTAQAEADQSAALKAGEPSAETSDTSVLAIDVDHPRVLSIEDLLTRLSDLTALRVALDSARAGGELAGVNLDSVRRLLGADAEEACVWLATLRARLHASGYLSNNGASDTLTPAALRRIGGVLVDRLFATVGRDRPGEHRARRPAPGIDLTDDLRPYRFGDRFTLDIHQTLMNAVKRGGSAVPVHLRSDDFVVNDAEETQMATTVLLLDLSRSMPLRGCFLAARKLAIALHALIQARYPRDRLHILGFTAGVEELDPLSLASLRHAEGAHGTNVQAALASARRLLGRHRSGNRQIVLITDGEPTAHTDSGGVHLAYPPVEATLHFTLREVRHCRLDGIVVNTVMLGRTAAAIDFVSTMTEVGGGHAFFATADRLDSIVLHQYVNWRRSSASAIP
jgi:uncharacterized protein with von Willebrand factor type A (vWA) domain